MKDPFSNRFDASLKRRARIYEFLHDLKPGMEKPSSIAIDTETMGLDLFRDRLCLIQLCFGQDDCYLVRIQKDSPYPAELAKFLLDPTIEKIFHYARFDLQGIYQRFGIMCQGPIYCTKIASKMARTYTDFHGLRNLCREILGVEISKAEQSTDWGKDSLTDAQKHYAAMDVFYLHALKERLNIILEREGRLDLFQGVCNFLPTRVYLDYRGFPQDIFSH